jgi:hypothetical protein
MMNGKEMDFEVPGFVVNGGVVNITVLTLPQDLALAARSS